MDWGIVARDVALLVLEYAKALGWQVVVLIGFVVFGSTIKRTIERINKAKVGDVEVSLSALATKLTHKAQGIEPELKVGAIRRIWTSLQRLFRGRSEEAPEAETKKAPRFPSEAGSSPSHEKVEASEPERSTSEEAATPSSRVEGPSVSTKVVPEYVPVQHEVDFAALGEVITSWAELESLVFDLHERVSSSLKGSEGPYSRRGSVSQAVEDLYRARMVSKEDRDTFKEAQMFRNIIVHAPGDRRFGTYAEFLATISALKEAVLSWYAKFR
jgi:hypothetical protein